MAITVNILNRINANTDESQAAETLKNLLRNSTPSNVTGNLNIQYSLTLVGQEVRDIDLFLYGNLDNFILENFYTSDNQYPKKNLSVKNLCMVIELKRHTFDQVRFSDTHLLVSYNGSFKDATAQNESQRYSMKRYLSLDDLYITNFIWLASVSQDELMQITNFHPVGALPSNFGIRDLVRIAINQGQHPVYDSLQDQYVLQASHTPLDLNRISGSFTNVNNDISPMTRRRMEILSQQASVNEVQRIINADDMVVLKGNAGTGKTFLLLQTALTLANQNNKRCIILTYNHALVSDIRRLLHYMNVPDGICTATVNVQTLHSFFISMMKTLNIDVSELVYNQGFERAYNRKLRELSEYVTELMDQSDIETLKQDNELAIDWDYVFIDEAQDWNVREKEILMKVYGASRLVIADGGQQYIRNIRALDWVGNNRSLALNLTTCRRQKSNLVLFANAFASKAGIDYVSRVDQNNPGGRIIIRKTYDTDQHSRMLEYCTRALCDSYDLLLLVPPTLVESVDSERRFKKLDAFKRRGFEVFDGTSFSNRMQYPKNPNECRLFQYESSRGLEGWVTVCMAFDKIFEEKSRYFRQNNDNGLALETREQAITRQVFTWLMIPLTRAIDTLYISVKDTDSPVARILREIAQEYPSFVECEI